MDKRYLLTYNDCGSREYDWFDTEEKMYEFIEENRVEVIEAFYINDADKII